MLRNNILNNFAKGESVPFKLINMIALLTLSLGFISLTSLISLQRKNSDLEDIITQYIPLFIVLPSLIFKGNFILTKSTCLLKHCCISWKGKKEPLIFFPVNGPHYTCSVNIFETWLVLCNFYCAVKIFNTEIIIPKKSLWANSPRLYYTTVYANFSLVL